VTGLELAALVTVAAWLAILSIAVLLCVRQLGVLTVGSRPVSGETQMVGDGLEIGRRVPPDVRSVVPGLDQLKYLLFVETGCAACRQLIAELADSDIDASFVAIIQGSRRVDELASLLPARTAVVRDPDAAQVFERMEVELTPTVLEIERGFVTGKGVLRGLYDLVSLLEARAADGGKVANELAKLNGLKVEVYDGGR
jgi:hypothetical protein